MVLYEVELFFKTGHSVDDGSCLPCRCDHYVTGRLVEVIVKKTNIRFQWLKMLVNVLLCRVFGSVSIRV